MDLAGKTILITGGTGSLGNALVEYFRTRWPTATLRIFSRDELKQSELTAKWGNERVRYLIGDIRDRDRLTRAMEGVSVVIHAAAMKQVGACEYNPFEAVQTNVIGAQNVVDAAIDCGVDEVVAISTDKAVNPVNIYGATKLCEEKIVVQGNAYAAGGPTKFSCVRYGNVTGSRGSVVPLFYKQVHEGRFTITDERMTRFWITLQESVELIMLALNRMRGGEIFVSKIPSVKIVDIAKAIAPDLPIEVTGIRPGEKLHEVLITSDEATHTLDSGDSYVVLPEHPWWGDDSYHEGTLLGNDFSYSSDNNHQWLDAEGIREALSKLRIDRRGVNTRTAARATSL